MMWYQRSKVHWMIKRDRNTKFFHVQASTRHRHNASWRIKDTGGAWRSSESEIQGVLLDYFLGIFASNSSSGEALETALNIMYSKFMVEMNERLVRPFTMIEVHTTLFGMFPLKSPGPNEVLSSMWHVVIVRVEINRVAICRHSPSISHLLFADDTIIFDQATEEAMDALKWILGEYALALVQEVNMDKSSMVVSWNVGETQ
ncbi:UNVERIFIED_CONTAM: hypothetical protein Slati_1406300 [Sesamum latifolium]|uniref:Reverse transcriptase domain-containing protein n=1 Tax=Sesamum latifolium TaxID=2727402 RepID=A0AAW2X5G0_9LAMI